MSDDRRIRTDQPDPKRGIFRRSRSNDPDLVRERNDHAAEIARLEQQNWDLQVALAKSANAQRHEEDERQRALVQYGGDSEQAICKGVRMSPRYSKLTDDQCLYVARVALLTGLNPEFELHPFPTDGKLVLVPDYKGLARLADRRHLMLKDRRLTKEEMIARGVPDRDIEEGAIGWLVEGYELDKAQEAKAAGIEYQPLTGFAWWPAQKDEYVWKEGRTGKKYKELTGNRVANDVPNGRDGAWVAWKRAFRALFNQITDLGIKLDMSVPGGHTNEDGDWEYDSRPQYNPDLDGHAVIDGQFEDPDEQPVQREQKNPDQPWQEVIADWSRANWGAFWGFMARFGLTEEDVHAALGVESVKDFAGTRGELNELIRVYAADHRESGQEFDPI